MNKHHLALLVAPLLALPGCQSNPAPYAGKPDPIPAPYNNPHIVLSQGGLINSLGFDSPIVTRQNDLLTVGVPTRSLGNERYLIDYRFVWYDEQGYEVAPAMGWKEAVLEPKGQKVLQANAMDRRATDWKMEVRWANR